MVQLASARWRACAAAAERNAERLQPIAVESRAAILAQQVAFDAAVAGVVAPVRARRACCATGLPRARAEAHSDTRRARRWSPA